MEINRREFLKLLGVSTTSAAVGALGAGAIFSMPDEVFERINSGPHIETWKNSICTLCPGGCGIRVRQIDGIPVKIMGNNLYPVNRGGICPRAETGIELLFHPKRIRQPLKRKGERDENKWEVIDWEEALNIITGRLQKLREREEPEKFVLMTRDNNEMITDLCRNFMLAYSSPNFLCLSDASIVSLPALLSQGISTIPVYDIRNSNYILNFDGDFLDTGPSPIQFNQLYAEMANRKEQNGARIIHISSYMSRTAANSSEWLAIKPGTMAALALAIAYVMIKDNSYDKTFINDNSIGFSDWQDSTDNWHQGFKNLVTKEYYPGKVAQITGIPAEKIIEIARGFASANPALALAGGQAAESTNSLYTLWAIYCLNALKGNFEKKGGLLFPNHLESASFSDSTTDPVTIKGLEKPKIGEEKNQNIFFSVDSIDQLLYTLEKKQPYPVDTIIFNHVNPLLESLNHKRFASALKDGPFLVSYTSFMNETANYADLILPEPVFLEKWEASCNVASMEFSHFGIQQPVSEPLYDTRHLGDVILHLKQKLGGSIAQALPWENYIGYIKSYAKDIFNSGQGTIISESMDILWIEFLKKRGWQAFDYSTFEEFWDLLTERGGWWDPISQELKDNKIFKNNSGKFEFFAKTILDRVDEQIKRGELQTETLEDLYRHWKIDARGDLLYLPHYEEPRFNEDNVDYPYHLLTYQLLSSDWRGASTRFLSELSGLYSREYWNYWVEINPETATSLEIYEGDYVRIISPKGQISIKVKILPSVIPGIVMMPLCQLDHSTGMNPYTLLSSDSDLMSNIPSLISTKVSIEKTENKKST